MTVLQRGAMTRILKWTTVAVIAVNVLLVATGVLDLRDAVVIAVGLELLCGVLALGLAVTARGCTGSCAGPAPATGTHSSRRPEPCCPAR